MEIKEVPNFKGYFVDRKGNLYSNKRGWTLRKLNPSFNKMYGYMSITIVNDYGDKEHCLLHRLIATTFIPNPDELPYVNHKDGDKLNNDADNLEWVTPSQNSKHAVDTGLTPKPTGILNPKAILSEEDVLSIYKKLSEGTSSTVLAEKYGVAKETINSIKIKHNWYELLKDLQEIPVKKRKPTLSSESVHWICSELEKGSGVMEIVRKSEDPLVDENRVGDIKRKRSFKYISKLYNF